MFIIVFLHNMINQLILVKKSKNINNRSKHISKMKYYSIMNYHVSIEYRSDQINYIFEFTDIIQFYFFIQNYFLSILIIINSIIAIILYSFSKLSPYSILVYFLGYLLMIINDYYVLLFKLV